MGCVQKTGWANPGFDPINLHFRSFAVPSLLSTRACSWTSGDDGRSFKTKGEDLRRKERDAAGSWVCSSGAPKLSSGVKCSNVLCDCFERWKPRRSPAPTGLHTLAQVRNLDLLLSSVVGPLELGKRKGGSLDKDGWWVGLCVQR